MSVKSNNKLFKVNETENQMDVFVYEEGTKVPTNPIATGRLVDGKVVTEFKAHTLCGASISSYTTLATWKTGVVAILKAEGYLTADAVDVDAEAE